MSIHILLCYYYIKKERRWCWRHRLWLHLSGYYTNTRLYSVFHLQDSSLLLLSIAGRVQSNWKGSWEGKIWRGWRRKKNYRRNTQISFVAFYLDYGFLWKFVSCVRRYFTTKKKKVQKKSFFGMVAILNMETWIHRHFEFSLLFLSISIDLPERKYRWKQMTLLFYTVP